ncbi:MAG: class D sortase [Clostridium sp.]|uniref:class D sortase n=1 Tax=Clostridium sp. TaxID=1506 RepID=UPI0025C35B9F|nr:class D sortase [Clostridium sp.]MCH3964406.1 class D sortase [Clostridium sp.]MCI1715581.1 class D sortase [Clostridium sp.]MCI1799627.1 class D sortase [Clostridium sp.]MCI1813765.1 class D sortase [Clostridium sp.]MCI1870440.1 class D sortase [Clostridium sp.]
MKKSKIIGGVLIFAGILILLYAFGARYLTAYRQNNMVKNYEQRIKKHKKNAENSSDPAVNYGTIGLLVISKINLKVAIGEGTDMDTLRYAVGHFKGTALPGQKGNFAMAGHRSYTYGQYFNRLDELKIGDEIIVETIKGKYKYKIYNKKVVLPEQVEVLNPTNDATMTLVTCTPIRVATHRLIVSARLEN